MAAVVRGTAQRALAVASRFSIAAASATLFLYTPELFPSAVVQHGMCLANYCGRLGAVVAPGLAYVGARLQSSLVPMLVLGSLCCAAGVVSALLPETLGCPAYDTIQELANANAQLGGRRKAWLSLAGVLGRDSRAVAPSSRAPAAQPTVARSV